LSPTSSFTITPTPSISPTFTVSPTWGFLQQEKLIKVRGLYPNPFSDKLQVYYTLRVDAAVNMDVYNVAGEPIWTRQVAALAGANLLPWAGENAAGGRCATGVYVLHFRASGVDGTNEDFWEQAAIAR
jgi:hypothetical protein